MAISLPIGSSNSGTNDWSDVHGNDAQLVTEIDARDDNYQTIFTSSGIVAVDAGAGTYLLGSADPRSVGAGGTGGMVVSGSGYNTTGDFRSPDVIYFDDADYTISSKTQKLRVRAQALTNATQPVITFTIGLYPVTVAGTADVLTFTAGTVVTGSTVAHASPAASTVTQSNSGDFTIPADGGYMLGVVTSATLTNNSVACIQAQLQSRHV